MGCQLIMGAGRILSGAAMGGAALSPACHSGRGHRQVEPVPARRKELLGPGHTHARMAAGLELLWAESLSARLAAAAGVAGKQDLFLLGGKDSPGP